MFDSKIKSFAQSLIEQRDQERINEKKLGIEYGAHTFSSLYTLHAS